MLSFTSPENLLFLAAVFLSLLIGFYLGRRLLESRYKSRLEQWKTETEEEIRRDTARRSRSTLEGLVSEQLSPYFPDFQYNPTDLRFIGTPVDFLVFKGLSQEKPEEVVFLEVKTGNSGLNKREKKIKELVEKKKVRWEEYRPKKRKTKNK